MVEPTYLSNTIVQYDDTNICVRQQLDGAVEFPVGAVCIYEATISTDRISRAWSIRDAYNFKTQASIRGLLSVASMERRPATSGNR